VNDKNESAEFAKFVHDNGINNIRIEVPAHKNPEIVIPIDIITRVLKIMLDKSNYPLLVHCNKGKVSHESIPQTQPKQPNSIYSTEQAAWWHVTANSTAGPMQQL
jgi:hypothetical protein